MKEYSIGEFADILGVSTQTVRNWEKTGKLKPAFKTTNGYRKYTEVEKNKMLTLLTEAKEKRVVCYNINDKNKEMYEVYSSAIVDDYEYINDTEEGFGEGLKTIIDLVTTYSVDMLILHNVGLLGKHREVIQYLCKKYNVEIRYIQKGVYDCLY